VIQILRIIDFSVIIHQENKSNPSRRAVVAAFIGRQWLDVPAGGRRGPPLALPGGGIVVFEDGFDSTQRWLKAHVRSGASWVKAE
jgi:hypothetical protein